MALTGTHRYVDTSATYNGDGTSPEQATSDGGTGAYNSIQSALSAAPNNPSSEADRWLIWVRRLNSGTNISITSTLSPANDGGYNAPHMLIGWPFREQKTSMSVDSVPTGTDSLGFNNAQWQFIDSALTEGDNYWVDAVVEFTSGSNSGLSRRVIWFDATNDKIYLNFPLPNDIAAGDGYTITLETHYYDDRPSAAQSLWDGDTNTRPVIDGGGGSFHLNDFSYDYYWELVNFRLTNTASNYSAIKSPPNKLNNLVVDNVGYIFASGQPAMRDVEGSRIYVCDMLSTAGAFYSLGAAIKISELHIQAKSGATTQRGIFYVDGQWRLKNVSIGRVFSMPTADIDITTGKGLKIVGENVLLGSSTKVTTGAFTPRLFSILSLSSYNGEPNKFHQWQYQGEIYNLGEDATIDPPSGATTYIKLKPSSKASSHFSLTYEEQRYQSSGSKTYTWKFYPVNMSLGATDLEVEAWYLDESTGTHRAYATANPSAYSDDGWHDLSITVNPSQAGTVYFKIKLKKYNTSGCYVALDPKVDVS